MELTEQVVNDLVLSWVQTMANNNTPPPSLVATIQATQK